MVRYKRGNPKIEGEMATIDDFRKPFIPTTNSESIEGLLRSSESQVTERTVVLCKPLDFGVVIGSTQKVSTDLADYATSHSIKVHRRSSGGSAVVIDPRSSIWIDIFLPPNDPLASTSIERTFEVASTGWIALLDSLEIAGEVYRGPYSLPPKYKEICFAGRAHGEILVRDKKVVGMAQRRRRIGTYIHTMAYANFPYAATFEATYGIRDDRSGWKDLAVGSLSEYANFDVAATVAYLENFTDALNKSYS